MIRGIGPVYAKKLLRAFGDKVFDIIEAEPGRLRDVDGIGPVRASRIVVGWAEQKVVREIMVFLHSHGVGSARAVRIYKTYGADAVQVMSENRVVPLSSGWMRQRQMARPDPEFPKELNGDHPYFIGDLRVLIGVPSGWRFYPTMVDDSWHHQEPPH
jgi:ATP-dependent exoDNAse (exonuclease V) alpha subunit